MGVDGHPAGALGQNAFPDHGSGGLRAGEEREGEGQQATGLRMPVVVGVGQLPFRVRAGGTQVGGRVHRDLRVC